MNKPIRKKLIEVALPLEAINMASAREKSIRHGHPSTLHLWWARRPLAAARAVVFSQMVDDPSSWPDLFPTEKAQEKERQRLFRVIEELVKWENTTNEQVLQNARDEIWRSWRRACSENVDHPNAKELFNREHLPAFHDPFAGGGALPLEAQRLGLEAYASDLNPVAVLINKAMIEIPPKFAGRPPIHPSLGQSKTQWTGAEGLAEDVRYYGKWIRDEAQKRIGHLYPKVKVTMEMVAERPDLEPYLDRELTVIAWIWARTVKSPSPAFREVSVPLTTTFLLSKMSGKEAYIRPIVTNGTYKLKVCRGTPTDLTATSDGTKFGRGSNFQCLVSGAPITADYIKTEGHAGRLGQRLLAVVAEGNRERVYLSPSEDLESTALQETPFWEPDIPFFQDALGFSVGNYGPTTWSDLFTKRQLVALDLFASLVKEARERALQDSLADTDPVQALEYANAIATYLGFLVSKLADKGSAICTWDSGPTSSRTDSGRSARVATVRVTFARQAIPMIWDFAEVNFFSDSVGSIDTVLNTLAAPVETLPFARRGGHAFQADAANPQSVIPAAVIATDPPYYDNIGYADLSDFFYVWLRRSLGDTYPELFSTITVPKDQELVATPGRHGGRDKAEEFFMVGMTKAVTALAEASHPAFPVAIFYAFKQAETKASGTASTGWETFLSAVIRSGFAITGTWPIRTELGNRTRSVGANALASSIVLVCRKRFETAPAATRREFLLALEKELADAVADLQRGNVAPVDLQQAAIGPGMAIFTRYSQVLDANGNPLSVREALTLINQALDEVLAHQEGDFDADTRWALAWFEQFGFGEGDYGVAETLSKAKNTSVDGIRQAGIGTHGKGKVRLYKPEELPAEWSPESDNRLTVWDMVHHLIRSLEHSEESAGRLLAKLGSQANVARELAYRLYSICERKKRSADAQRYNGLVSSWPELIRLAQQSPRQEHGPQQSFEGMN